MVLHYGFSFIFLENFFLSMDPLSLFFSHSYFLKPFLQKKNVERVRRDCERERYARELASKNLNGVSNKVFTRSCTRARRGHNQKKKYSKPIYPEF